MNSFTLHCDIPWKRMIHKKDLWNSLKKYTPFYVLAAFFIANTTLLWPGQMSPDSHTQYSAAITGIYNDHHPPIMSALWCMLDQLYPGSGLLFLFHLILLYSAAAFFMASSSVRCAQWLALLLPLMPPISLYSSLLWKDVGFACAYLLAIALMSFCSMHSKRLAIYYLAPIILLLFYGTGVKFQAQYVLFIPLWGLSYCLTNYTVSIKTYIYTVLLSLFFAFGLKTVNTLLVPTQQKSHSWQLVKLYDLAGISMYTQKPLFPGFTMHSRSFSMDAIRMRYNHERVDDLIQPPNNPLQLASSAQERTTLLNSWYNALHRFPFLYLKHRLAVWWRTITIKPIANLDTIDFNTYKGLSWFNSLQHHAAQSGFAVKTWLDSLLQWLSLCILTLLYLVRYISYLAIWLPFLLCYFVLGITYFHKSRAAVPLIMLNGTGILFLSVLFFCTMASAVRYVYIVFCMIHASHSFAYLCIRKAMT